MINVEFQNVAGSEQVPCEDDLYRWLALAVRRENAEIVVRIVDEAESAELNGHYRQKDKPTNVLSFPFEAPPGVDCDILGDLVLCSSVIEAEAKAQGKSLDAHWAHMLVHGALHLQGFDHIDEDEALVMETEEIALLKQLGFANPYEEVVVS